MSDNSAIRKQNLRDGRDLISCLGKSSLGKLGLCKLNMAIASPSRQHGIRCHDICLVAYVSRRPSTTHHDAVLMSPQLLNGELHCQSTSWTHQGVISGSARGPPSECPDRPLGSPWPPSWPRLPQRLCWAGVWPPFWLLADQPGVPLQASSLWQTWSPVRPALPAAVLVPDGAQLGQPTPERSATGAAAAGLTVAA